MQKNIQNLSKEIFQNLSEEICLEKLHTNNFFEKIIHFEKINSTNSELLEKKYENKTLIYTFNQVAGRGRLNRKWVDFANKNLALSIVLTDIENISINNHIWITAVLAISLIEILKLLDIKKHWIKWPNDIYIGEKKLAGILTESKWAGVKLEKIVSGIGININTTNDDISTIDKVATSLYLETNKFFDLNEFTQNYINILSKNFNILFKKHSNCEEVEYYDKKNKVEKSINSKNDIEISNDIELDDEISISNSIISSKKFNNISKGANNIEVDNMEIERSNSIELANNIELEGVEYIKKIWLENCNILDRKVKFSNTINGKEETIEGVVKGIDNDGSVIIDRNGFVEKVTNGEFVFI